MKTIKQILKAIHYQLCYMFDNEFNHVISFEVRMLSGEDQLKYFQAITNSEKEITFSTGEKWVLL